MICFFTFKWPITRQFIFIALTLSFALMLSGCTKKTEVVRYVLPPSSVSLIFPIADSIIVASNPTFIWHKATDATRYHLQVSPTSDFVNSTINTQTGDTSHTAVTALGDNTYYWRVRGQDLNGVWGDWSDAEIRLFYKSGYISYFDLISQTETNGTPNDVFVRDNIAYVADGQADLSVYNIAVPSNPSLVRNIDTGDDDFAKGVYVAPTSFLPDSFPYAFVADMDGKIQALNVADTNVILNLSFGTDQNLEDVTGLVRSDTLWILAVSSGFNRRKLSFYKILYSPTPDPYSYFFQLDMPADAMGVCTDGNYIYIACGTSGLRIVSISDIYAPLIISTLPLPGTALSVDVKDDIAYVAADRSGLFVINLGSDRLNPTVLREINTAGRTKDVQVAGNYAYMADADHGLRAVDISVPDSAHIVATYVTPYAYGLWADTNYIYICDRDLGLLIFVNRVHR